MLIAVREITERLRSKLFLGVNAFLVLAIIAAVVLPEVLAREPSAFRLGVADPASARVAEFARAQETTHGIDLDVTEVDGRATAERALVAGDLDAALVNGSALLVVDEVPTSVELVIGAASQAAQLDAALDEAGMPAGDRARVLAAEPLVVEAVGGGPDRAGPAAFVAFLATAMLYGLLIFLGQWIAMGIVEEKQSRVIELLLSSVRTRELLAGKIVGLGLLGLAQIVLLVTAGVAAMVAVDRFAFPPGIGSTVIIVVAWFLPGYALYATLFAVAGALAARSEDLQATTSPMIVVLVVAMLSAQAAAASPTSTFATIAAYVPFTAPMVQPVRFATGAGSLVDSAVAAALAIAVTVALVPIAARIYRGGALHTNVRVSVRAAWRSAGR